VDSTNSDNTLVLNDPADADTVTIGGTNGVSYSINNTGAVTGAYYSTASMNYGNITISNGGSSGSAFYSNGAGNSWATITSGTNTPSLKVTGDAEFEEDIKIKGISVLKTLEAINKRLAILQPDPAKLEKFEALKKAYDHYKLLEALCHEEKSNDN
jgi:hypothetical protein